MGVNSSDPQQRVQSRRRVTGPPGCRRRQSRFSRGIPRFYYRLKPIGSILPLTRARHRTGGSAALRHLNQRARACDVLQLLLSPRDTANANRRMLTFQSRKNVHWFKKKNGIFHVNCWNFGNGRPVHLSIQLGRTPGGGAYAEANQVPISSLPLHYRTRELVLQ